MPSPSPFPEEQGLLVCGSDAVLPSTRRLAGSTLQEKFMNFAAKNNSCLKLDQLESAAKLLVEGGLLKRFLTVL